MTTKTNTQPHSKAEFGFVATNLFLLLLADKSSNKNKYVVPTITKIH